MIWLKASDYIYLKWKVSEYGNFFWIFMGYPSYNQKLCVTEFFRVSKIFGELLVIVFIKTLRWFIHEILTLRLTKRWLNRFHWILIFQNTVDRVAPRSPYLHNWDLVQMLLKYVSPLPITVFGARYWPIPFLKNKLYNSEMSWQ